MKLEKWALIAEIFSGFAIIVTLAVLIYETRQNTDATYAASYDLLSRDLADWRMALASNPEMQASYFEFVNRLDEGRREADDGNDTGGLVGDTLFLIYERAYFGHTYGRLADEAWERYERVICGNLSRRMWPVIRPNLMTKEFSGFVDECLRE